VSAQDLTRLTVNLTARAVAALNAAAEIEQLSKTDTVNRALQAWAYLLHERAEGAEIHLVRRRSWWRRDSRKVNVL